jgi:hypothetical protein
MDRSMGCTRLDYLDGFQERHVEHDSCGQLTLIAGAGAVRLVFPFHPVVPLVARAVAMINAGYHPCCLVRIVLLRRCVLQRGNGFL